MAESSPRLSAEDKKRYDQGVANYEAPLKKEEKAYELSLARRRKVYDKFEVDRKKRLFDATSYELTSAEKAQQDELDAAEKAYKKKLALVKDNEKAKKKLKADYEKEIEEIELKHEVIISAAKTKNYAAELDFQEAILLSEQKLVEISDIYIANLERRIPVQERLKKNDESILDTNKDQMEAIALLFGIEKRASEEATLKLEEISNEVSLLEDSVSAASEAMKTLSPDTDEWLELQKFIDETGLKIESLSSITYDMLYSEIVGPAIKDAEEATDAFIAEVKKRTKIRESETFKGEILPTKSKEMQSAIAAEGSKDVSKFVSGTKEDIKSNQELLYALRDAKDDAKASGDAVAEKALEEAMRKLETTIASQQSSIKVADTSSASSPFKDVLTDLGKAMTAQTASLKVSEKKDKLEEIRTNNALKKQEEAYYKENGGAALDRQIRNEEDWAAGADRAAEHNANIDKNIGEALKGAIADLSRTIDDNINTFFEYQASIEGRLQGSNESYKDMLKTVSGKINVNPFVSQKEVVENIKSLVETGVSYNVELRSFLQTVSDDIAATFDAFDANLMRLIRMQQADSTAARLGMEATLTKLFNSQYKDTSYLANSVSDSVAGAILEASSLLSHKNSLEFEYAVQKWLGSMYSVGVSDETVNRLAQGINYLGTGNVEALSNDESLQNLFAMAAERAGLPYAEILVNGLDADTTNKLLRSITEYLLEIATNTDNNQVTKTAYSNVFGVSIADMNALTNLYAGSADTLNALTNSTLSWSQALDETSSQIGQIGSRTHISHMIDNIVDNIAATTSIGIGSNGILYGTWKALNMVNALTGGIKIPGIQAMGWGLASEINILEVAKGVIAGAGFLGGLIGGLGSGGGIGNMDNLKSWGYEEQTERGKGRQVLTGGVSTGFSQSNEIGGVGSGSGEDVKTTSTKQASDEASESSGITSEDQEKGLETPEKTLEALDNGETTVVEEITALHAITADSFPAIIEQLGKTNELLALSRTFKTVSSGMDTLTTLLSPNRVFYMINPTTVAGDSTATSIKYDLATRSLLYDITGNYADISSSAMNIALENSKITSAMSSTIRELGISSNSIVDTASILGYAISESVSSSNEFMSSQLVEGISNELNRAMMSTTIGGNMMATTNVGNNEERTSSTTSTTTSNQTVQTTMSASGSSGDDIKTMTTTITALYTELMTNKSPLNVTVGNTDNMKVSLNDISTVRDPLANVMKEAVQNAMSAAVDGGDEDDSLADRIANAIADKIINVRVSNDYFDTVLENKAFDV